MWTPLGLVEDGADNRVMQFLGLRDEIIDILYRRGQRNVKLQNPIL
jgi:hypothetical protein